MPNEKTGKMEEMPKVVFAGLAYYPFLHTPQKDEEYGDKYKIDLMVEDAEGNPMIYTDPVTGNQINVVDKILDMGFASKLKEANASIPGRYIRLTSKATKKDGSERPSVPVTYADKTPLTKETLIGNGSKVRVRALIYTYGVGKAQKQTLLLDRVIVDELVPYVSARKEDEFDFPHLRGGNSKKAAPSNELAPFDD
jgi:hypothetical protein